MTNPPPQKPTFEERLTDAAIKSIVAGSGFYALYNLYVDDLPKAAIAGSIAIASTLLTKFGEGLTGVLGDRMKERGESTGNVINTIIDSTVSSAIPKVTGFRAGYLEAVKHSCYALHVEGASYISSLTLEEIYVPLSINPNSQRALPSEPQLNQVTNIWDFLPHHTDTSFPYRLLAIVAEPGYGKTTLMRFLTLSFANQTYDQKQAKGLLPILLLFREIHDQIRTITQPKLPNIIFDQVKNMASCEDLKPSVAWFDKQLKQGQCLVMLDGLDEVPENQRELVSQWANWQMQNYASQFILTSRPHGYDSNFFDGVDQLDILDFNNEQKRTFIRQWYESSYWDYWYRAVQKSKRQPDASTHLSENQAKANSKADAQKAANDLTRQLFAEQNLIELAKNPLLLTIIAATHEAYKSLPKKRIQVYQRIFRLLLEDRPNKRKTRLTLDTVEDNQHVLQGIAVELTKQGKTTFTAQQGEDWIHRRLKEYCPPEQLTPKAFLQEIDHISNLLAGGDSNLYEFTHKTFQEYLAAVELSQSQWGLRKMMEQFTNESWREVVYFFAMITDPSPFIEAALADGTQEHTLKLAQRLAIDHPKVNENLRGKILNALQALAPDTAELRLQRRFQNLTPLNNTIALSGKISTGEYQLFLRDQANKQFHSWAADQLFSAVLNTRPVQDISWEDARWFCAWLSTQADIAPDNGTYHYRLPTVAELKLIPSLSNDDEHPWTTDPNQPGNRLQVIQEPIPDRYANLVNYLASDSWKEADQETYELMLAIAGEEAQKRQYLQLNEIKNFPCEDLLIIDQLWVKFSGGKFGFSVQKKLWVEVGGKLDFGEDLSSAREAFKKISDRNGWLAIGYRKNKVTFDTFAPDSHLPFSFLKDGIYSGLFFSRIASCEL